MRLGTVALVFLAATLGVARPALAQYTPSPADWRAVPIYQIFTDRFWDGDPSNNNAEGSYDPGSTTGTWRPGNVHGGDFAGVLQKLDYIQSLGFKAVWISPVVLNANGEYHGYAARDFEAIAPHFGTQIELRALADALHARGMYLIIDIVTNHMGNMIYSTTSGYPTFHDNPSPYVLKWRSSTRPAAPFNNLAWFHNNGEIQNYVDPDQVLGELAGLDDLKTEDPTVRNALVNATRWLIDVTDCDGFRIDTVKHVDMAFWQTWTPAVRAHADSLGKSNFFFYGEVFDGSDAKCGSYTGTEAGGAFALNSVLYFPMHYTMRYVFGQGGPTDEITNRYANLGDYDPAARDRLVGFLDNHDVSRFLSAGVASQDWSKLRTALDFLLLTRGVPCVYQGTEQGFDGGGDPYDREDMWDGEWDYGPSVGDNFNMTHPLYLTTRRLLDIRAHYDALRTGGFTELASEGSPGIYAFRRSGASENVVVVINTETSVRSSGALATGWSSGEALADLLDPAFSRNAQAAGVVNVSVPARSARVLVRSAAVVPETPVVWSQSPAHGDTVSLSRPPIRLGFNRSMDHASVEAALGLDPPVSGSFSWEADSAVTFTPSADIADGTRLTVRLAPSATAASGGDHPTAAFETFFVIAGGAPGLTVAPGYHAEVLASGSALGTPEGIALGEGGAWGSDFFVGDAGGHRILRVTPVGGVTTLATDALLGKPEGLDFDHGGQWGGDLLVADVNGLLRVTAAGAVSQIAPGTSSTNTGALASLPPGVFGGYPYLGTSASNRVERYEPGTGFVPFASPVNGFEGVTPGWGLFGGGEKLLVADPDLTAYASSIDGPGAILTVDAAGTLSPFVQDAALLGGASALLVDTGGGFGGDLLVADIALERVLRVTPQGAISVLASGFGNLFSSDCLAIGTDGALFVVDTGSGEPFTDTSGGNATARIIRIASDTQVGTEGTPPPPTVRLRVFPNPLTGAGRVEVNLERGGTARLVMYDLQGREVAVPFSGPLEAGTDTVSIDLRGVGIARGVYFLRLVVDERPVAAARVVLR